MTAHKTQAVGQKDGYTILAQGEDMSIPTQLGDDGQDLDTRSTKDQEDVVMAEGEADTQQQQQHQLPLESLQSKSKIGFHHYLSAEYIDT